MPFWVLHHPPSLFTRRPALTTRGIVSPEVGGTIGVLALGADALLGLVAPEFFHAEASPDYSRYLPLRSWGEHWGGCFGSPEAGFPASLPGQ
eukprot:6386016-Pyramimonas_sp.AAC.1